MTTPAWPVMDLLPGWRLPTPVPDEPPVAVWRIDVVAVPADPASALGHRIAAIAALDAARADAARRLTAFVASGTGAGISFAAEAGLRPPERALADLLAQAPGRPAVESFGLLDPVGDAWQRVVDRFRGVLDHIRRSLAGLGMAETLVGGIVQARSLLRWDGDIATIWRGRPTAALASLHRASLSAAHSARRQLLALLETLFTGAALLAVVPAMASNPAGLIAALAAAWSFIERVAAGDERP